MSGLGILVRAATERRALTHPSAKPNDEDSSANQGAGILIRVAAPQSDAIVRPEDRPDHFAFNEFSICQSLVWVLENARALLLGLINLDATRPPYIPRDISPHVLRDYDRRWNTLLVIAQRGRFLG
jgi:hypothetical protein